jgi:hypothetical protein
VAYIDDVDSLGRSKNYGKKGREPILWSGKEVGLEMADPRMLPVNSVFLGNNRIQVES